MAHRTVKHTAPKVDARALTTELMEAHKSAMQPADIWAMVASAANFYSYSRRNCQLIAAQGYGDSPGIASYAEWCKRGRQVRKGERALYILAPMLVVDRFAPVDPGTGEPPKKRIFKPVPVFAYEQTDPAADAAEPWEPAQRTPSDERTAQAIAALESLAGNAGITVHWQVIERNNSTSTGDYMRGQFNPTRRRIVVFHHADAAANLAVLAHEVAHSIHTPTGDDVRKRDPRLMECVAEISSYGICKAVGVADPGYSSAYAAYFELAQLLDGPACDQLHADIAEVTRQMAAAIFSPAAAEAEPLAA